MNRSRKVKLLRAKRLLRQTLQNILEINHYRKGLTYLKNQPQKLAALEEELKLLNKIAEQQAGLVRYYESILKMETSYPSLS